MMRNFSANGPVYTSAEPCAMCAGAAYWTGISPVVYGLSEKALGAHIGAHPENLTMSLDCRQVCAAGQRTIEVVGPLLEEEARAVHEGSGRKVGRAGSFAVGSPADARFFANAAWIGIDPGPVPHRW
jgi:hypothetical protein